VMEALGGPREIAREADAATFDLDGVAAPVVVAIAVSGGGWDQPRARTGRGAICP